MLQVLELPEGAQLLATSQTAPYEIWSFQDRVLAIQGHPEMVPEDMLQKIWPFLSSNGCAAEPPWSPHGMLPWEIVNCIPGSYDCACVNIHTFSLQKVHAVISRHAIERQCGLQATESTGSCSKQGRSDECQARHRCNTRHHAGIHHRRPRAEATAR